MSWGVELWDKYAELTEHTANGIDFLENSVANLIKDRSKIEAEYAKSLRGLIKKYQPKESNRPANDEFTHMKAYKEMLDEVGFQANQHEVLAQSFGKEQYKSAHEAAKRLRDVRKRNMKEADRIGVDLKQSYRLMDTAKGKFRKALEEQEKAFHIYKRACDDGSIARNEVQKLQLQSTKMSQHCEKAKGNFASQLVKTNEFQCKYYRELLPNIIQALQVLEEQRINTVTHTLLKAVAKEKEVMPIVLKCLDSMECHLNKVNIEADSAIVIERFKSGDVPPGDFKFEEMDDPQAMLNQDPMEKATNLNLYQKKRELERHIEECEKKLALKEKEKRSIEVMVDTYKNNPKYGNSKHFAGELENLGRSISEIQVALASLEAERKNVEDRLEALRERSPMVGSPMLGGGTLSRGTPRSSHSSGSLKSSLSFGSSSHAMNTSPDSEAGIYGDNNEWDDFDQPPPPPPPGPSATSNGGVLRCVALYPYPCQGEELQDSNIIMDEGEEFEIVEDDSDGWTRVRRLFQRPGTNPEGYVPTSFLRVMR